MVHPIPTSPFIQLNEFCTCTHVNIVGVCIHSGIGTNFLLCIFTCIYMYMYNYTIMYIHVATRDSISSLSEGEMSSLLRFNITFTVRTLVNGVSQFKLRYSKSARLLSRGPARVTGLGRAGVEGEKWVMERG